MHTKDKKMSITNYKKELAKLTKKQLLDLISINPKIAEILELKNADCFQNHNDGQNGVDGYRKDGHAVEIKTQIYYGNFLLKGRGKYGGITFSLYNKKIQNNEYIIVVGLDYETGEVYYRFGFYFSAIAKYYLHSVELSKNKPYSNYDFLPKHYVNDDTFTVLYIADEKTLEKNKEKFDNKFFKFLKSYYNPLGLNKNIYRIKQHTKGKNVNNQL